jgi:hypothetical protein
MSTSVAALRCPIREQLVSSFKRLLDHYNHSLAVLMNEMPLDEASNSAQGIFDACIEARKQLTEHEREHGCASNPPE